MIRIRNNDTRLILFMSCMTSVSATRVSCFSGNHKKCHQILNIIAWKCWKFMKFWYMHFMVSILRYTYKWVFNIHGLCVYLRKAKEWKNALINSIYRLCFCAVYDNTAYRTSDWMRNYSKAKIKLFDYYQIRMWEYKNFLSWMGAIEMEFLA